MTADVVLLSLEAWDDHWRRNQYLVTELLRADPRARVLFVEPPADPVHEARRGFRPRSGRGLQRLADRLWRYEPTKLLPRRVDRRTDERLATHTARAAHRLGMHAPVLWVNDPAGAAVVAATGWPALYDVTDDWLAAERTDDELQRLRRDEEYLLAHCREVVVCSPGLARSKGGRAPVTLISNGVDVERYRRPAPRPSDLPVTPTALYLGTVHRDRFDVDLLRATAHAVADTGRVVVVGPVLDLTPTQVRGLRASGVLLLGRRPWHAVPGYLQHAGVLLVPHLVNDFTESLDPIKAYEYRAVGRPVVATPVAGFRGARGTRDTAVTVVDAARFPAAVRRVLADRAAGLDAPADLPADVPTWAGQARLMAAVLARVRRPATTPR